MKIGEIMNRNVTTIGEGATLREAAETFHHTLTSDLMVVNDAGEFVGVLSEGDLVREIMPKYEGFMLSSGNLYEAFGMFMEEGAQKAGRPVDPLVIRDPITFASTDDAVKAAATMVSKQIRRLPVVDEGKLVGTLSRADVAFAVLT
jgi:CBS domain-containing protein